MKRMPHTIGHQTQPHLLAARCSLRSLRLCGERTYA